MLTWKMEKQVASIRTAKGWLKIAFEAGPRQVGLLQSRKGESGRM
jgi:hypothetical protein